MALSNQRNLTTVIILMATTLLPLSGPLLAISLDISKAHSSDGILNTTTVVSEFLDNQTNAMDEENYPTVERKSTKLRPSDLSSSLENPQIFQQKKNSSCLATKETNTWTRESKSHMTKRPGFFEDPTGLVRVDADESLEGEPGSLYGDDGAYNRSINCSGIISINCTLQQFKKEHIDTSTGDAISEPPMNLFKPDSTLTFTCQGRCGKEMSFPCSCRASCVVYGTCCDNMTQDCPHIWEEGMTRFDHMLGADTVCHEDRLYMISSCPRSLGKDADGKGVTLPTIRKPAVKKENICSESQSPKLDGVGSSSETRDIIEFDSEKFSNSGRDVQESIVERLKLALSAAPVTDADTGFTFINRSIYDCNNMSQSTALPGGSRVILPWSHAQCPIPDPNTELSVSPGLIEEPANAEPDRQAVCSVTCLNNYFKAPTDGRCKTKHSAFLAIADDGLPPLCPSAMKSLADFLVCGLKSEVKSLIYADWSSPSVSAMFDASTNKTLYVVKINFDLISLTRYVFSTIRDDVIQNIYHVALLVKSFKTYQSSHNLCSRQDLKKQNLESDLEVIRTSSLSIERFVQMWGLDMTLSKGMEQLRGPIVNKQDTATVCLTAVYFSHRLKLKHLRCMEDPERERDKSLLHDFRDSSCFSYLENLEMPDSNGADTVMPRDAIFLKMLVLVFIILMVAPVKTA
ncbi:hypothetical protein PoB_003229300 [Plakobranchus ocellatus]|uniref:SMB domain-containing protein n=1 Tax=Plakobranchus ocellatus TaxID=259542 RepID=A0AAV4AGW9_9GAST|nr:hypothetical protein PoB_003229300 [Plakobranchus ocellatus]